MKKFLGAALSAALILPSGWANAELLKNLKVGGELQVQAISANNAVDFNSAKYDQIGDAQTRVLLNTGWDLLDDVHSNVSVTKNNRAYGQASEHLNTVESNLFVDQANVKVDHLLGNIDATLGRQFYGTPNDLVAYFGPHNNVYGMAVTALDAFRFDWAGSLFNLTGLVGKTVTNGLSTAAGGVTTNTSDAVGAVNPTDLRALNLGIKGNDTLSGGVNLYNRVTHLGVFGTNNASTGDDYLWVLGGKAKFATGGLTVKGEFDKNFGQDRLNTVANGNAGAYSGWAFLLDLASLTTAAINSLKSVMEVR